MNKKWWKEGIVYQIYPRSFNDSNNDGIGDLRGIIRKVDYLKDLGVDIIWLCPVYKSPNDDNGYDISDYYSIMSEFGTFEDWQELTDRLHANGIRIIMDLVINHTSDEHEYFIESKSSKSSPYRDYYIWRKSQNGKEPSNWKSFFQGSVWKLDERSGEYYLHMFSKKQPDLNWENPKVREDIHTMIKWWLDQGIDGFRLDAINMLSKDITFPDVTPEPGEKYGYAFDHFMNRDETHDYLREMNQKVFSKYNIMTVGECSLTTLKQAIMYTDPERSEMDMIFHFEIAELDYGKNGKYDLTGWKLSDFKKVTEKWQKGLHGRGWNSIYLTNHDQPRAVSRYCNDTEFRVESAKLLMTYIMTLEGTPYIYQGEEIGMTNVAFDSIEDYDDIESVNYYHAQIEKGKKPSEILHHVHRRSRDNARTPMQWDGSRNAGFTVGKPWLKINPNYTEINVQKDLENNNSIFRFTQKLIALRKENKTLVYGKYASFDNEHEQVYIYERFLDRDSFLIILNFSDLNMEYELPAAVEADSYTSVLSNYSNSSISGGKIRLEPFQAEILRRK